MANTQSNSILKKNHQIISNLICMFNLKNNYLDWDDNWSGKLEATDFVVQSTYHNILQSMPSQLVSVRGIILNTPLIYE